MAFACKSMDGKVKMVPSCSCWSFFIVVVSTRYTNRIHVSYITLVDSNTVVLCGKVTGQGQWKLSQYDLQKGTELNSALLDEMPWGISGVTLNGRSCLAVAYM